MSVAGGAAAAVWSVSSPQWERMCEGQNVKARLLKFTVS